MASVMIINVIASRANFIEGLRVKLISVTLSKPEI
jgi:hypothetical protein